MSLAAFDDSYEKPASRTGLGTKIDELPDGDYTVEISEARYKEAKGNNIFEIEFSVLEPEAAHGAEFTHGYFVNDKEARDRLAKYLLNLGFDTPNWLMKNDRPFSVEFGKALRWMKGMRVKTRKDHFDLAAKDGKPARTFHNLHLNGRDGTDGIDPNISPEQLNEPDPTDPFGSA